MLKGKLTYKQIKDLNINPVTVKLAEEKLERALECTATGDYFLNLTPLAQTMRLTINKWDILKLRSFCKAKDTVNKITQQTTEWEKILTNPTLDKGLISKIYKELKKLDIKIPNNTNKKMGYRSKQRILNRRISNGKRYLRKCQLSQTSEKCKSKQL